MLADSPVVKRWLELYKPSVVAVTILAVGLILGVVVVALAPAETQSATVVAERGADFSFLDHELKYAGGYALRPAAGVERGADFDFIDRELKVAGGYGLVAVAERETGFDFLDRELACAGGYSLVAAEREAGFSFLDHELKYAGGYGLAATAEK